MSSFVFASARAGGGEATGNVSGPAVAAPLDEAPADSAGRLCYDSLDVKDGWTILLKQEQEEREAVVDGDIGEVQQRGAEEQTDVLVTDKQHQELTVEHQQQDRKDMVMSLGQEADPGEGKKERTDDVLDKEHAEVVVHEEDGEQVEEDRGQEEGADLVGWKSPLQQEEPSLDKASANLDIGVDANSESKSEPPSELSHRKPAGLHVVFRVTSAQQ